MVNEKKANLGLTSYDDLFETDQSRADKQIKKVVLLDASEIDSFPEHPFKVLEDDAMSELVESVKQFGVLQPISVRQKDDGRYELISGHRRKYACELAGITEIRAIVEDMSRDDATIAMVDSNLQRERIFPSEKAFAYKMRLDAMKRQAGRPSKENVSPVGTNLRSDKQLAEQVGESRTQIQRYIRLTNLVPDLLRLVDEGKIAIRPAEELSYLSAEHQQILYSTAEMEEKTPSHAQAIKIKQFEQEGKLNDGVILSIMREEKPNQKEQIKIPRERITKFFPAGTPAPKIEDDIVKGLELLHRQRERKKDAR